MLGLALDIFQDFETFILFFLVGGSIFLSLNLVAGWLVTTSNFRGLRFVEIR